jgi:hypothetical protein
MTPRATSRACVQLPGVGDILGSSLWINQLET